MANIELRTQKWTSIFFFGNRVRNFRIGCIRKLRADFFKIPLNSEISEFISEKKRYDTLLRGTCIGGPSPPRQVPSDSSPPRQFRDPPTPPYPYLSSDPMLGVQWGFQCISMTSRGCFPDLPLITEDLYKKMLQFGRPAALKYNLTSVFFFYYA